MHRLAASFVLGYHGCDRGTGESLLKGEPFRPSANDYDWLGPGVYFWEANPQRGLEFARESSKRRNSAIQQPFVVGAVIELGLCLDLTTSGGIGLVKMAYRALYESTSAAAGPLPTNSADLLRRPLDCAVMRRVHSILQQTGYSAVDTVRGLFTEGDPIYPGAGFREKTHVQIAVCNPACIKGVFRVPAEEFQRLA